MRKTCGRGERKRGRTTRCRTRRQHPRQLTRECTSADPVVQQRDGGRLPRSDSGVVIQQAVRARHRLGGHGSVRTRRGKPPLHAGHTRAGSTTCGRWAARIKTARDTAAGIKEGTAQRRARPARKPARARSAGSASAPGVARGPGGGRRSCAAGCGGAGAGGGRRWSAGRPERRWLRRRLARGIYRAGAARFGASRGGTAFKTGANRHMIRPHDWHGRLRPVSAGRRRSRLE